MRAREDRFWPLIFLLLEAEYPPKLKKKKRKKNLDAETAKLRQISTALPSRDFPLVFFVIP